jgi:hypothetical protein
MSERQLVAPAEVDVGQLRAATSERVQAPENKQTNKQEIQAMHH